MSRIEIPKIETVESGDKFGHFTVEPLDKGMGVTLGNALRRVLLGYLTGAAVTWVQVEGIQHEFSTIPHMKEDTLEFLLNVKGLRLKLVSGRPGKMKLEVEGEGRICAADIKPSEDFEITNPELYLGTLDSPEAKLSIEFNVDLGVGYKEAGSDGNLPVGAIPVDAIFTPIRKVNFNTEPVHIGRETSRERLHLEVWTDGTISPVDALSQSATVLTDLLSPFLNYAKVSQVQVEKETARAPVPDERHNITIEELDLSVRTLNALRRAGIITVGELIARSEKDLLSLRNFGQKSKQEVVDRLKSMGLALTAPAQVEGAESLSEESESV